jgi:hypothetical protein
MKRGIVTNALACLLLGLGSAAFAADLFSITAQTTSGTPEQSTVGGQSVIDLADQLINNKEQFAVFENRDFAATLTYAGIEDAVRFSGNAAGTEVTLAIPSTGFSKTFTGTDRDDLEQQIEDFLKKEGSKQWSAFQKKVNELSTVAVSDGNPQATTAWLANQHFSKFALQQSLFDSPAKGGGHLQFDATGEMISSDNGDGHRVGAALTSMHRFGDRVGLSFSIPLNWRQIESANVFDLGLELGLPIGLIPRRQGRGLGWQVTPFGFGAASASVDYAAGGLLVGGGMSSHLSYQTGQFIFTMGNQVGLYEGTPVSLDEYRFDNDVSQVILKNGGKATWRPNEKGALLLEAGLTYTNLLRDAAVNNYWTPFVGIGLGKAADPDSGLRVGYAGDFGSGYTSHGGYVQMCFKY